MFWYSYIIIWCLKSQVNLQRVYVGEILEEPISKELDWGTVVWMPCDPSIQEAEEDETKQDSL